MEVEFSEYVKMLFKDVVKLDDQSLRMSMDFN